MTILEWHKAHNCSHAHCPDGCDTGSKSQPFLAGDKLYCGRCYFVAGLVVEMIPCTPEVCRDEDWPVTEE
jgi:hypothetical protein